MRSKAALLSELQTLLRDVFKLRESGHQAARFARAHGYVDGFMRALLETGVATNGELLAMVAKERERVSGPALGTVGPLEAGSFAA